jgi:hypothetical protein
LIGFCRCPELFLVWKFEISALKITRKHEQIYHNIISEAVRLRFAIDIDFLNNLFLPNFNLT